MNAHHLVTMANRIADFFAAMPDHEEQVAGVADHLHRFWEPRMRRQLDGLAAGAEAQALHPLVREALARQRVSPGAG
jgi:formate dehydrogenase subunit delta